MSMPTSGRRFPLAPLTGPLVLPDAAPVGASPATGAREVTGQDLIIRQLSTILSQLTALDSKVTKLDQNVSELNNKVLATEKLLLEQERQRQIRSIVMSVDLIKPFVGHCDGKNKIEFRGCELSTTFESDPEKAKFKFSLVADPLPNMVTSLTVDFQVSIKRPSGEIYWKDRSHQVTFNRTIKQSKDLDLPSFIVRKIDEMAFPDRALTRGSVLISCEIVPIRGWDEPLFTRSEGAAAPAAPPRGPAAPPER